MPKAVELALMAGAGMVLGLLHFGGLLWTVGRLSTSRHPAALVLLSSALRCILLVALLLWLGGPDFGRVLALMVGIGAGRLWWIRYSLRGGPVSKGEEG